MDAWQYFFDDHGKPVGKARAGDMEYDRSPGHQHWHFEQFARYTLTDADKTEVVRSHKEAFCLAPTDPIDLLAPNAEMNPYPIGLAARAATRARSGCASRCRPAGATRTSSTSRDSPSTSRGLPNGRYFVEVRREPAGNDLRGRHLQRRDVPPGRPEGEAGSPVGGRARVARARRPGLPGSRSSERRHGRGVKRRRGYVATRATFDRNACRPVRVGDGPPGGLRRPRLPARPSRPRSRSSAP